MKKDSVTIKMKVSSCHECVYHDTVRTYGAGFAQDWLCKKSPTEKGFRVVAGYVESDWPKIPEWCPFRIKNPLGLY